MKANEIKRQSPSIHNPFNQDSANSLLSNLQTRPDALQSSQNLLKRKTKPDRSGEALFTKEENPSKKDTKITHFFKNVKRKTNLLTEFDEKDNKLTESIFKCNMETTFKTIPDPMAESQKNNTMSAHTLELIESVMKGKLNSLTKPNELVSSDALRINNNTEDFERILMSVPLRQKYECLIARKELPLPAKYQRLFLKFKRLDQTINELKNDKQPTTFYMINKKFAADASQYKLSLTKDDFEKILYVAPVFYVYQSKINLSSLIDLVKIDIPVDFQMRFKKKYVSSVDFSLIQVDFNITDKPISQEIINQREKFFRDILLSLTVDEHDKFLSANNIPKFNPKTNKTWSHLFDLDSVGDVPNYKLIESKTLTSAKKKNAVR